jgi:pimeloyl-ACP methyl ester carboxylesterase
MAMTFIFLAVTCTKSPTSPDNTTPQANQLVNETDSTAWTLKRVTSVDYEEGTLPSGALFEFRVPDVWNGDVVVYAHGYVHPQDPLALPDDEVGTMPIYEIINGMNYAYISTSYRRNGLVIPVAVEDLVELVDTFRTAYPSVNHVFLAGVSEGGLITTLALEQHPDMFDGGFAGCGPIGDFVRQLNYFGNFRVVFDYFFPGVIPGSPVDIPQEVIDNWGAAYMPQVMAAITASPHKTEQLLRVTRAPIDDSDPSSIVNTVITILEYNVFATNDAVQQLGGQPIDNSNKFYLGSDNDFRLNRLVERFHADQSALNEIEAHYQTSGEISIPLSTIHTTGDQIVPYWQETLFRLRAYLRGSAPYISDIRVSRYGHCNFQPSEVLAAFAVLVAKVTGQNLMLAESTLPSPSDQSDFLSIAAAHGATPKIIPDARLR